MLRKLFRIAALALATLSLGLAALVAYASYETGRVVDAPYPPIAADRSPEGVARGAQIFHTMCEGCHRSPDGERAAGAPLEEIPSFLGRLYAPNITAHPEAGIGALRDEEIARTLRYGVDRHGRKGVMGSAMGDADLAAVIGFLRSDDPLFAPDPRPSRAPEVSLIGNTIFLLSGIHAVPDRPASGIPVPPRRATVEYGRYLATAVYDCVGCHTAGYSIDKADDPHAYEGGATLVDPSGAELVSPNLTPHATGLGAWSRDDFVQTLRTGVRPDGVAVRAPMPRFRHVDEVDLDALWVFLRSLPPAENRATGHRPLARTRVVTADGSSARASFDALGCASCHAPGARYHANLRGARGKDPSELARWIRHPEQYRPGTPMPTYAALVDEPTALALGRWIAAGGSPSAR